LDNKSHWYDWVIINIYWLGSSMIADTMTPLVIPLLVQGFIGEAAKGTAYGTIRLWSLMIALLSQSVIGAFSDRSSNPYGKRRPYILAGGLLSLLFMAIIGFTDRLQGPNGYWVLLILVILLAISTNSAQAALQGLIPDLVPAHFRGRFSAIKAIFEVPLPLILITFTVARQIASGHLRTGILTSMAVVAATLILAMLVPEKKPSQPSERFHWASVVRLGGMVLLFTGIILIGGNAIRWLTVLASRIESSRTLIPFVGLLGLICFLLTIAAGVWFSLKIGLGIESGKNPAFTWWIVNRLAFMVGATNLGSYALYFLQARFGFLRESAARPASLLTMYVGIFILVFALPSGWFADRFGRKPLLIASGIVGFLGTGIAIFAPSLSLVYVGGCFIGAAVGIFYTSNWALGTSLVPNGQEGKYLGISNLAGAGAGAIGAYIGGPIADFISRQIPQSAGEGYILLFSIYGILFLISALAVFGIQDPDQPESSPEPVKIKKPVRSLSEGL